MLVEQGIQRATVKGNPMRDERWKKEFFFLGVMALVSKLTHEVHRLSQQLDIYPAALAQMTGEAMEAEHNLKDNLVLFAEHVDRGVVGHGRLPKISIHKGHIRRLSSCPAGPRLH